MQADKIYPNRELIMNKESRITEQSSLYDHLEEMSVEELTMFGLKGMAAYYEHAARLGKIDERIIAFMAHALAMISKPNVSVDELFDLVLETGKTGVDVMVSFGKDLANCS